MPRHDMIDGVAVPFTVEQEAARDVEEAEHESRKTSVPLLAQAEIVRLENEITPRRLREAYADPTWMNAQEALIAIERAKL